MAGLRIYQIFIGTKTEFQDILRDQKIFYTHTYMYMYGYGYIWWEQFYFKNVKTINFRHTITQHI